MHATLRHAWSGAILLLAILVWGLLAIIVGIEANARGRSAIGWSTLAFLISPFVAGGILLLSTWQTSVTINRWSKTYRLRNSRYLDGDQLNSG